MINHFPLTEFAAELRNWFRHSTALRPPLPLPFEPLARRLFALQFEANPAYRRICEARGATPATVNAAWEIPAVPTAAFKELELTALAPAARVAVFHSSGTTGQKPSRHWHSHESLALYEASLSTWFQPHLLPDWSARADFMRFIALTPPPAAVPHSSLAQMFATVQREFGHGPAVFTGRVSAEGAWEVNLAASLERMDEIIALGEPVVVLGTAFSFVHLADAMAVRGERRKLPAGSRVMETGGYKGRSRELPRADLHALITNCLGVPATHLVCEYGMSEMSSQAYAHAGDSAERIFKFPPWARASVLSPETGREVGEGETGLLRVLDLANVWSVMAIQTEDLAVRRGDGFELRGRAAMAEPRGCSLMTTA